jgi:hypothetical protein
VKLEATFEITGWEQASYDDPPTAGTFVRQHGAWEAASGASSCPAPERASSRACAATRGSSTARSRSTTS